MRDELERSRNCDPVVHRAGKVSSAYQERISARKAAWTPGPHAEKRSYSESPDGIGMFDHCLSGSGKIALAAADARRTWPRPRPTVNTGHALDSPASPTRRRFLAWIPVLAATSSPGTSTSRPYCSSSRPPGAVWQNMGSLPGGTSLGLMAVCHRTVIGDRSSPPHASFSSSATPNPRGMIRNCRTTRAR
jgi:hypothetical protein